jgi:hypothetical protein
VSHAEVAAMTNYEAAALGLPAFMEAVVSLRIHGRIDLPDFSIEREIEPLTTMHPWVMWRRVGAVLFVGEKMLRLNLAQWRVLEAVDAIGTAGADVAARLKLWPAFAEALHGSATNHVLLLGDVPHLRIQQVGELPASALTREGRLLRHVGKDSRSLWAMVAGRRYFLREV